MSYNQPQQMRPPPREAIRIPLTTNQHILHLILTVLTFGLWGIVWLIRGLQGNKVWADTQPGYYRPPPPYGWQPPLPPAPRPPVTDHPQTGLQRPEGYQ